MHQPLKRPLPAGKPGRFAALLFAVSILSGCAGAPDYDEKLVAGAGSGSDRERILSLLRWRMKSCRGMVAPVA